MSDEPRKDWVQVTATIPKPMYRWLELVAQEMDSQSVEDAAALVIFYAMQHWPDKVPTQSDQIADLFNVVPSDALPDGTILMFDPTATAEAIRYGYPIPPGAILRFGSGES